MSDEGKIKIAFSGGGFRAAFYCLGAFRRLVELGLWKKVCRIDSVSGGSITAGAIMQALGEGDFKDIADFDKRVTGSLKNLGQCRLRERILYPIAGLFLLLIIIGLILARVLHANCFFVLISTLPIICLLQPRQFLSNRFEYLLNKSFFINKKMNSLPTNPVWSVNATCLNTGKRFRFKQTDFGGQKIGVTEDNKDIRVSFAVACSAAFPQVFAPLKLRLAGRKFFDNWWTDTPLPKNNPPKHVYLSDGGVYDNLGSEEILTRGGLFIILDAGGYLSEWVPSLNPSWVKKNMRIIDTALNQIISLRRRLIYSITEKQETAVGTMLILGASVSRYLDYSKCEDFGKLSCQITEEMPSYNVFPEEIDKLVSDIRTDLDSFHDIEIEMLMWAGAIRMDIMIKKYLKKCLTEAQFKNTPQKPNFSEKKICQVLTKGSKTSIFGFLHRDLTA